MCSNELIDHVMGFRREKGMGVYLLLWCWRILSIPLEAGRRISAATCGLGDVFPPDDLRFNLYYQFIIIYKRYIS